MTKPDLPPSPLSYPLGQQPQASAIFEENGTTASNLGRVDDLFAGRRVHFTFNTRTAIRSACDALGLASGDEVLVPAYNCGSEVDPLLHAGLRATLYPVGCDLVADPDVIAKLISPRTRAVYVTHYFGLLQPRLAEIRALCDARGLRLMEDCALSLLSGPRPVEGRTGDVSFFCFHKFFSVPSGSALVINTDDLPLSPSFDRPPLRRPELKFLARWYLEATIGLDRLKKAKRTFRKASVDHTFEPSGIEQDIPSHYYFDPDLMGRGMSGLTANVLRHVDLNAALQQRRQNWHIYRELLAQVPQAELLLPHLPHDICPHSMPVLIPNRDRIVAELQAAGFDVTAWWAGFHQGLDWTAAGGALTLKNNVLSLPLDPPLTQSDLVRIVGQMKATLAA